MNTIYFRPKEKNSAAADFIPFYDNGVFHLFYLFDHRNCLKFGEGVDWNKITTTDFTTYEDCGVMIKRGSQQDLDLFAFTGSVIKVNETYHIFYTGHNPYIKTHGEQNECIMHATSLDLINWKKIPEDTFDAPDNYDKCDFRDPFVYFDESQKSYYMLLCARNINGSKICNGETIRMKSQNLRSWDFDTVVYAPNEFQTHEYPDLFRMGKYWYLIFSEYSDRNVTCYRMSQSPNGPWIKPKNDTFDGRAYYAAKTACDGENRYLFGWVPTRTDNKDNGNWMWGGNLVVHKLSQNKDGSLSVSMPQSVNKLFTDGTTLKSITVDARNKMQTTAVLKTAPSTFKFGFVAKPSEQCDKFGIRFRHNEQTDNSYGIVFDLTNRQLFVNRLPCFPQNEFLTYQLNRPLEPAEEYRVEVVFDDDIAVVYVNDQIALSVRVCNLPHAGLSVFANNGVVEFDNITVSTIK